MELVEEIKHVLEQNTIYFEFEEQPHHRYLFHWNEMMRDAGMSADNVVLDFNIDDEHEVIFLGLIRLPRIYRGQGLARNLIRLFKKFAREHHYSVILESAPENLLFWQKMHFSVFLYEEYGFWMMGYGGKSKQFFKVKWLQIKPHLYSDVS